MSRGRISLSAVLISLSTLFLHDCDVLEDRDSCGCRLVLDMSDAVEILHSDGALALRLDGPDGFHLDNTIELPSLGEPPRVILTVPRGECALQVFSGRKDIPYGDECPEIYMHTSVVNTDAETVEEKVLLHKCFCRLTLIVKMPPGEVFPYRMTLRGDVSGYDSDGSPTEGPFCKTVMPRQGDRVEIRIPRQMDSSLSLLFTFEKREEVSFAVGEYIAASGYDWTAPDLKDIALVIDYATARLFLTVDTWTTVVPIAARF